MVDLMMNLMANLSANVPMALCLFLGAALLVVEVFLPGFGLPGVSGVVLIGAGVVLAWQAFGPLVAVAILLVLIAVLAVLISWVVRKVFKGGMHHSDLFLSDKEELHTGKDMEVLVGRKGIAISVLRPAGIADFDGVRLNVVTEGGFIERDTAVEIARVEGARIVVRRAAKK